MVEHLVCNQKVVGSSPIVSICLAVSAAWRDDGAGEELPMIAALTPPA